MEIINWRLVSHPLNWLTVLLMLFIAGIALHLAMQAVGIKMPEKVDAPTPSGASTNQNVPGNV